jgi:hypothetical protein
MTKYLFQGTLHRTRDEMLAAIAEAWITGGGNNGPEGIAGFIADGHTGASMARECIDDWGLDEEEDDQDEEYGATFMEFMDFDESDLAAAMSRYLTDFALAMEPRKVVAWMDGSQVIDRLGTDEAESVTPASRWHFQPDDDWSPDLFFATEHEACAAQQGWRIARGFDPITGGQRQ